MKTFQSSLEDSVKISALVQKINIKGERFIYAGVI